MPEFSLDAFLRDQGKALRKDDVPPVSLPAWLTRRDALRKQMLAALGGMSDKPCDLEPRTVGTLKREGYRIEKLLLQTRPDVWMTATAYIPEPLGGKVPAVLVVHGHWPIARRDPVVQARCLGLVKLGFFVLAVDAFGAGERHPTIQPRSYHGALLGSTLWPAGLTLLGVQVYDNRRAVDYLLGRPEVDGSRLGITGASGGGNQSMYAGALDDRIAAVVPVCSIGTYQAYLQAACCVCEVLPGALRFTEEGDVLGLVAPRALLVINATRDAYQFSVGEATKSVARARSIFDLYRKPEKLNHATFESGHDYSKAMRETMYGWMVRWLKGEGDGKPIPEPAHTVEKPEDLACFPDLKHPVNFLFPPTLAARQAKSLLAWHSEPLDHPEAWEAHATLMRRRLETSLGQVRSREVFWRPTGLEVAGDRTTATWLLSPEPGIEIALTERHRTGLKGDAPTCLLLAERGLDHPLVAELVAAGQRVVVLGLRGIAGTGTTRDAIGGAPDHTTAEHALWIGRPLLGQWVVDVQAGLHFLDEALAIPAGKRTLIGVGQPGVVALVAGAIDPTNLGRVVAIDTMTTYLTQQAYAPGTRMGLLVPGILQAGDIPHLAALLAPRRLLLAGGVSAEGKVLDGKALENAFRFTRKMYALVKQPGALLVREKVDVKEIVAG